MSQRRWAEVGLAEGALPSLGRGGNAFLGLLRDDAGSARARKKSRVSADTFLLLWRCIPGRCRLASGEGRVAAEVTFSGEQLSARTTSQPTLPAAGRYAKRRRKWPLPRPSPRGPTHYPDKTWRRLAWARGPTTSSRPLRSLPQLAFLEVEQMFGRPGRVNQGEIPLYQERQRDFSEEVSQVLWLLGP